MNFFDIKKSILGLNARNLLYVGRYNTRANKKFADDKMFTKNYLSSRGIGVAKVFVLFKNHKEIRNFNPKSLPDSFVIKPNKGYGGEGILVIVEKKGDKFLDIDGNFHDWKALYRHMVSILDGKYAISGRYDMVILEERLEIHEYFKRYSDGGLPDIRILVFNYVPIIAMLRLPTNESHGKANLHLGAVGVGIDIATGKSTYAVYKDKFVKKLPNGEKIKDIKIPDWDKIILMASTAQHVSQIGFLAVDMVLTTTGIKVLELNARAGLGVQIANQVPLKRRLDKVIDLKVPTPEKGVEVSQALFSSNIPEEKKKKPELKLIIGLYEEIDILNSEYNGIVAKIDPHASETLIDISLHNLGMGEKFIDVRLKDKRITLPFEFADFSQEKYKIVISGKFLKDFLIDLNLKEKPENKKDIKKQNIVDEKKIKNLDKKLFEIDKKVNVLSLVKPVNLDQEKVNFLSNRTQSPRFFYSDSKIDVEFLKKELKTLPKHINHPLAKLFSKKIDEINAKLSLVGSLNSKELQTVSERLYGKVDKKLYDRAVKYINSNSIKDDKSKILNCKQIQKRLEEFLKENKLVKWKIKVVEGSSTDIAINKSGIIILKNGVEFTENRLKAVIIHEICTHIYRFENGKLEKYKIFENGTANYITTEEGLAIYNQKELNIPLGLKDFTPALLVIGIYLGDEMSFAELFQYLKEFYKLSDERAWRICFRVKRGLIDTSRKIVFTRDLVYFKGYMLVKDYLEKNGQDGLKNLYIGKIGINDLQYLGKLDQYKVRYLPKYVF